MKAPPSLIITKHIEHVYTKQDQNIFQKGFKKEHRTENNLFILTGTTGFEPIPNHHHNIASYQPVSSVVSKIRELTDCLLKDLPST